MNMQGVLNLSLHSLTLYKTVGAGGGVAPGVSLSVVTPTFCSPYEWTYLDYVGKDEHVPYPLFFPLNR